MKNILFLLALLTSHAQAAESPCYFYGTVAKCFPVDGIYLDDHRSLRLGEDAPNGSNYVELIASGNLTENLTLTFPDVNPSLGQVISATDTLGALGWTNPGASTSYVDGRVNGLGSKSVADLVCHSNVTLSGIQTCDGQSTSGASRLLLMAQTDVTENGLWLNDDFLPWTRSFGWTGDLAAIQPGSLITVDEQGAGTSYQDTLWFGIGDGASTFNYRLVPTTASNMQLTASRALVTDSNSHLAAATTTTTEIGYVNGVTSAIQTQLNAKTTNPGTTTGDVFYCSDTATPCTVARRAIGSSGTVLHGGTTPSYSAVSMTADVTGTLPAGNGGTGITSLGSGVATWLGTPSSANLASAVTDETGSGSLVFGTAPVITLANGTGLPLTTGVTGTLPVANGGTGITSFGTGIATWLGTPSSTNLISAMTDETGTGQLVFSVNPILTTPNLGVPTAITLTAATGLPLTSGVTGILPLVNGGTGASAGSANVAFNALSPLTMLGDTLYGAGSGAGTRLGGNTTTTVKFLTQTGDGANSAAPSWAQVGITTGVSGLGIDMATFLATPTSLNLKTTVTDETGSGSLVFATAPTITLANGTGLPLTTGVTGVLPIANGGTNSATQNWVDLMTTQATIAGTKTFTGQLIGKGTATNDDAAAGYIGEILTANTGTDTNVGTTNQYFDAVNLTLTAGDWDVSGVLYVDRGTSTYTSVEVDAGIWAATGNSSTGLKKGCNFVSMTYGANILTFGTISDSTPITRVTSDGTNLAFCGTTASSTQVIRLKGLTHAYSGATPTYQAYIRARRVR